MKVSNIKIKKLKPYKNNPRINQEAIEYVKNSIKEFGFKVPLVIDKNYEIVTGHTRYLASKELGLDEVPCIIADDLDEEQIKLFRLVDNKVSEYSKWDYSLLNEEIDKLLSINMEKFGFEVADDGLDFIEQMMGSEEVGEGFDPDLSKIAISFNKSDEYMVNTVIKKITKEEIIKRVLERIGDGS